MCLLHPGAFPSVLNRSVVDFGGVEVWGGGGPLFHFACSLSTDSSHHLTLYIYCIYFTDIWCLQTHQTLPKGFYNENDAWSESCGVGWGGMNEFPSTPCPVVPGTVEVLEKPQALASPQLFWDRQIPCLSSLVLLESPPPPHTHSKFPYRLHEEGWSEDLSWWTWDPFQSPGLTQMKHKVKQKQK